MTNPIWGVIFHTKWCRRNEIDFWNYLLDLVFGRGAWGGPKMIAWETCLQVDLEFFLIKIFFVYNNLF